MDFFLAPFRHRPLALCNGARACRASRRPSSSNSEGFPINGWFERQQSSRDDLARVSPTKSTALLVNSLSVNLKSHDSIQRTKHLATCRRQQNAAHIRFAPIESKTFVVESVETRSKFHNHAFRE